MAQYGGVASSPRAVADKDGTCEPSVFEPLIYRRMISLPGKYVFGSPSTEGRSPWHGKYPVISWSGLITKRGTVSSGRELSSRIPANVDVAKQAMPLDTQCR